MGTVLAYVFYWLAVIVALVYTKYKEVRIYHTHFIFYHTEQPLKNSFFFPRRAELKFSDTNPKPVFASGNV